MEGNDGLAISGHCRREHVRVRLRGALVGVLMIEWTEFETEFETDERGRTVWKSGKCSRCNVGEVVWFSGCRDADPCPNCRAEHNSSGQLLRDDWRSNLSNYDDEIGDLEGFEMAMERYPSADDQRWDS